MNNIIQKRTELINFFLNQEKIYTKEDILNKEFSVLSFSPSEEYIDTLHSDFDDLCIDLSTHKIEDTSEIYIKGIIVDVDRQNYQTIIHLQRVLMIQPILFILNHLLILQLHQRSCSFVTDVNLTLFN